MLRMAGIAVRDADMKDSGMLRDVAGMAELCFLSQ